MAGTVKDTPLRAPHLARFNTDGHQEPPFRRRSSLLAFSSLDDTIRPNLGLDDESENGNSDNHWHSSPLAFALLPPLAGLFFHNGSAFVTDVLLLGLAALFLNWSVRLPWDWYYSAQAAVNAPSSISSSVILERHDEVDARSDNGREKQGNGEEQHAGTGHQNPHQAGETTNDESDDDYSVTYQRRVAASKLRTHEKLALVSTFLLPVCAAYLLHVIRNQLSRPSNGLVSDYNLTIFLLAAEIRPVRQLIRLVTNRTLHLQRVVSKGDGAISSSSITDKALQDISARLERLEGQVGSHDATSENSASQKNEILHLSSDLKRRYEPRLDALERAVRRYEKRATTLTLLTEQRLQSLDARLQDALSLAAVAANSSQKPGLVVTFLSTLSKAIALPLDALWYMIICPIRLFESVVVMTAEVVLGKSTKPSKRRTDSRQSRSRMEKDRKRDDGYYAKRI